MVHAFGLGRLWSLGRHRQTGFPLGNTGYTKLHFGALDDPWGLQPIILQASDKNNSRLNRRQMGRFRQVIDDLELNEIQLNGRAFTWSNAKERPTLERIDRVFVSTDWEQLFPDSFLRALPSTASDHCPLLLSSVYLAGAKKRFQFESFWTRVEGFKEAVAVAWKCDDHIVDPLRRLNALLIATGRSLQSWSQSHCGSIRQQIGWLKELIDRLDLAEEKWPLSPWERWFRMKLKRKLLGLCSFERTIARQRSCMRWLREGDANTRFFHLHANRRRRRNYITGLMISDSWVLNQKGIEEAFHDHFVNSLGKPVHHNHSLDLNFLNLSVHDLRELDADISEQEVWETIKSLPSRKAPGPDGFTSLFYQHCWDVIKPDIMAAFQTPGRLEGANFHHLSRALLTLLSKKQEAQEPSDFRPISLIHSFTKNFSKVLARRLAPNLAKLVASNQSTFIKARSIQGNFLLVRQSACLLQQQKKAALLLKLDIAQAFNSVS